MDAGDNIKVKKSGFSFGGNTPKKFDAHVLKSVPLYEMGQDMICKISSFFLNKDSNIYDLGCSTGTLIKKIIKYNSKTKFKIIGIDKEKNMIREAKKKLKSLKRVSLKCADLRKHKFKNSDLFISYYTIQFIKPKNEVGYDEKQIYHKSLSIRGVLEPFTSAANIGYLKRAGFKDVMSVMKYGSFEGFLAIK